MESRREELRQRRIELADLAGRIDQLFREVHLSPADDDPLSRLRQLAAALTQQRQLAQSRTTLRRQDRRLGSQCSRGRSK